MNFLNVLLGILGFFVAFFFSGFILTVMEICLSSLFDFKVIDVTIFGFYFYKKKEQWQCTFRLRPFLCNCHRVYIVKKRSFEEEVASAKKE